MRLFKFPASVDYCFDLKIPAHTGLLLGLISKNLLPAVFFASNQLFIKHIGKINDNYQIISIALCECVQVFRIILATKAIN